MSPPRKRERQKTKPWDLTVPGYNFLRQGTSLDRVRHVPDIARLDEIAKELDMDYEKRRHNHRRADNKFIKAASKHGVLGKTAIHAKRRLGLDDYFRQSKRRKTDNNPPTNNNLTTTRHR